MDVNGVVGIAGAACGVGALAVVWWQTIGRRMYQVLRLRRLDWICSRAGHEWGREQNPMRTSGDPLRYCDRCGQPNQRSYKRAQV